jgi:hypothetical protein
VLVRGCQIAYIKTSPTALFLAQARKWSQVRVVRVVSTTDLLNIDLRNRLTELYKTLISYHPPYLTGVTAHGSFDDTRYALKTISDLDIHCGGLVCAFTVKYLDGTSTTQHGAVGGSGHNFSLGDGKPIG